MTTQFKPPISAETLDLMERFAHDHAADLAEALLAGTIPHWMKRRFREAMAAAGISELPGAVQQAEGDWQRARERKEAARQDPERWDGLS